jgi:hypothetical protein
MKNRIFFLAGIAGGLMMLGTGTVRAELPPSAYAQFKAEAPEILRIQVLEVKDEPGEASDSMDNRNIQVKAKVLFVRRSKKGVKTGDSILISYQHSTPKTPGWVGPAPVPILKKGTVYRAYLSVKGTGKDALFAPAARGQSFEVIPPAGLVKLKP